MQHEWGHSAKLPAPVAAAPNLASVAERDDGPPEGAPQSLDAIVSSPAVPKTPRDSSPPKPPISEMHPSRNHQSMAPPSSGLRLGFTDIRPSAKRFDELPAAVLSTPSKIAAVPTSDFTFSFARRANADLKLGPEAQQMMDEIREQAQQIKAKLAAEREVEKLEEDQVNARRFARPKGKAGRFSAAHMIEFKKMDSIENHPSAFRAQPGRVTPLKAGIKRSQSKANLDEPSSSRSKQRTPASTIASPLKQKASASTLAEQPLSPIKRARQHITDDASSNRPVSRDGSTLPRPKSAGVGSALPRSKTNPNLSALMTPTKSSLARASGSKTPIPGSLLKSPLKSTLRGIPRSTTTNNLATVSLVTEKDPEPTPVAVPVEAKSPTSRFDRVKSMFQRHKASPSKRKSALPLPAASSASKAPMPARTLKEALPTPKPIITPRKLIKRVAFTPDTQRAALSQTSPSPVKSGIPRSKSRNHLGEVYYPTLDGILSKEASDDEPPAKGSAKGSSKAGSAEPMATGTFTFRSDHTIKFGDASPSFGTSPGQASVRQVRPSILPTENMPGSFPSSVMTGTNKENEAPRSVFLSLPHGMKNKKRNRPSTDEQDEEQEAEERAAKKRKQESVPEGDALLAPRLIASAKRPIASPRKPLTAPSSSPMKKKGGISLSRLQMLSMPKMRK
ncbi:hypothetical protein B0T16DRAFT_390391 [Cercophora newfieldiana]|uniref:Erythromycin esterase n=1 Tax=Cercophora newfieldiana TaxID=92897 RepID=A0AA39Y4F5_9PEZI|nr:hypothetical protein B0T16DRAFT_390391 [Cercophora newfieldiana]